MKKVLFLAAMLCMASQFTFASKVVTEKPQIENSVNENDGWQSLGLIKALNYMKGSNSDLELYIKIISGVKYYKVKYEDKYYAVVKAPRSLRTKSKHYIAGDFIFNLGK